MYVITEGRRHRAAARRMAAVLTALALSRATHAQYPAESLLGIWLQRAGPARGGRSFTCFWRPHAFAHDSGYGHGPVVSFRGDLRLETAFFQVRAFEF